MRQFKIGDMVKIKSWEEMVEEFELDEDGDISIRNGYTFFSIEMREFCGNIITIESYNLLRTGSFGYRGFLIIPEMVHFLDEEVKTVGVLPEYKTMTIIMPL